MRTHILAFAAALLVGVPSAEAQSVSPDSYDVAYVGDRLADPVIQHAKETYIVQGCAYCHGVNLEPRGEAPDLRRSRLVGRDTDGTLIVALLKAGIPQTAKLSPMPQFSDLSDQQLHAIATWIHYARAQARFRELTTSSAGPGNAAAGKTVFEAKCATCHATNLAGISKRYTGAALKAAFLKPALMDEVPSMEVSQLRDQRKSTGRLQHRSLLENHTADDAANLWAFLAALP